MQVAKLPAREGLSWIRQGWRIFRLQPIHFSTLLLTYFFVAMFAILLVRPLGPFAIVLELAFAVFAPGLSVGFLEASRTALSGAPVYPAVLVRAFRQGKRTTLALLGVGAVQIVIVELLLYLIGVPDLDLSSAAGANGQIDLSKLSDSEIQKLVMFYVGTIVATVPVTLLLWYAPVMVAWHKMSTFKAIFFSIAAFWRNRMPFLVFVLGWAALLVTIPSIAKLMFAALGAEGVSYVLLLPVGIMMFSVMYCSHYPTYQTVFPAEAETEAG